MTTAAPTTVEYPHTTADLAAEFRITGKTLRKKAKALNLGIDLGGRAGFRYSDADRQRLIESLKPEAVTTAAKSRKTRRAA